MGKNITVSAVCLALMLTACTKEKGTDLPAEINNTTASSQILRIAAAANLSASAVDVRKRAGRIIASPALALNRGQRTLKLTFATQTNTAGK